MFKNLTVKFLCLSIIYFGVFFSQERHYEVGDDVRNLYFILIGLHVFAFFYYKKTSLHEHKLSSAFQSIIWSHALIGFSATLIVSVTSLRIMPRSFILLVVIIPLIVELSVHAIQAKLRNGQIENDESRSVFNRMSSLRKTIPLWQLLIGVVTIPIAYLTISYIKYDRLILSQRTEEVLLLVSAAWLLSLFFTRKYDQETTPNISFLISAQLKSAIIMITLIGVPYFFFRLEAISRFLLFGTGLLTFFLEITSAILIYLVKKSRARSVVPINAMLDEVGDPIQKALELSDKERTIYDAHLNIWYTLVKNFLGADKYQVQEYLNANYPGERFELKDITVMSSSTWESVQLIRNQSIKILANYHALNDQRRLNEYFIACHNAICDGGLLIGCFEPLDSLVLQMKKRMPRIALLLYYPLHFMFFRVLPKVEGLDEIYFALTRGKNRVVSKAEIFGRLSYCGFKVIAETRTNGRLHFAAAKVKTVCSEKNPSYGAVVGLKRVGTKANAPLVIYKLRTMHPYSEFIQEYVYEHLKLDDSGKFKNDFRLTQWGKVFRKYWIDELPQLFNWIRGDVKLVGVRALSFHYYSLYPDDIKALRVKTKPGLVPPFYADLPQNFEEILESERQYLIKSLKRPVATDFIYFFKAVKNIIFKGSRSK